MPEMNAGKPNVVHPSKEIQTSPRQTIAWPPARYARHSISFPFDHSGELLHAALLIADGG
jgi:hypothetical protein